MSVRVIAALVVGLALGFAVGHFSASKAEGSGLDLIWDQPYHSTQDALRDGCWGEDNGRDRIWRGYLQPGESHVVTLPFCPLEPPYGEGHNGPGQTGFTAWYAASGGAVSGFVTTAQDAILTLRPTVDGGERAAGSYCHRDRVEDTYTIYFQGPCEAPGRKYPALMWGGTWTVTFRNDGSESAAVVIRVFANTAGWAHQSLYFPLEDRDQDISWTSMAEYSIDPRMPLPTFPCTPPLLQPEAWAGCTSFEDAYVVRPVAMPAALTNTPTATPHPTSTSTPGASCFPPKARRCR